MADNKKRHALSDDSLNEVSGGHVKDLGNGVIAVLDNNTGEIVKTFKNKHLSGIPRNRNKGYWKAYESAVKYDNEYHHHG